MGKEEILSKLNIKDYNNELEKIIEKKAFSEDVKNLLLSMLYKIENGFDDYKKVKAIEKNKKSEFEKILRTIDNECDYIELVKPKLDEKTILGDKNVEVVDKDKKIITYPNEKSIYYGICMLAKPKYAIEGKTEIIEKYLMELINCGWYLDEYEVIKDFDGWTWNVEKNGISNFTYNLIYKNIQFLLGEEELLKWRNDKKYFTKIKKKLGEKNYNNLCKIAIIEHINNNQTSLASIKGKIEEIEKSLEIMSDKKNYLEDLAKKKKNNEAQIRKIDNLTSNLEELKKEFVKVNSELDENAKIFSLSDFVEVKQKERKKLLKEINECSECMKPTYFVEKKELLENNLKILSDVINEKNSDKFIIEIQKEVLKKFMKNILKIETKKEIYDIIYKLRYYKELYVNFDERICEIEEINSNLKKVERAVLTMGCNFNVLNIFSNGVNENYEIIKEIFNTRTVDLEDLAVEFKKKDKKIIMDIYEGNHIWRTIEYEEFNDLGVKLNKKVKLFI